MLPAESVRSLEAFSINPSVEILEHICEAKNLAVIVHEEYLCEIRSFHWGAPPST